MFSTCEKHRSSNQRPRTMFLHCSGFLATCVVSTRKLFRGKLLLDQEEFFRTKVIKKFAKWKRMDLSTLILRCRIKWRVLKTNRDVKLLKKCLTNESLLLRFFGARPTRKHGEQEHTKKRFGMSNC